MTKIAWILLAGEFTAPWRLPRENELIIATDGGIDHAKYLGGRVDHWLGDFDSTSPALLQQYSDQSREIFPSDKEETDFELALMWLQKNQPTVEMVFIVGGSGEESDHVFANFWVLSRFPFKAVIFTPHGAKLLATGKCSWRLKGKKRAKVSIFALTEIIGLSAHGLRWSVENMTLKPFYACASRNEIAEEIVTIDWKRGSGAIFLAQGVQAEIN